LVDTVGIVSASGIGSSLPVAVHVALHEPGTDHRVLSGQGDVAPELADRSIDWSAHGIEPRWLGMETSDCVAALNPSVFHNQGGIELDRFLDGARSRGEVAVIISAVGDPDEEAQTGFSVFGRADATILLPGVESSIGAQRLPAGAKAALAPALGAPERNLGLRLLSRATGAPWWSLSLRGMEAHRGDGTGFVRHTPTGELQPILVDGLGAPVAAVWISESGDTRWYVIPAATPWPGILDWLVENALAGHVPGALRRARSPHALDPALQTPAESAARTALDQLDASYNEERRRLENDLEDATSHAEPIRHGLLYGTGHELEDAVRRVLDDAGFDVVALDKTLGTTSSADLLATYGGERMLVEVKSASGTPGESLVEHLYRHLKTWPELRPDEPVGGGALVVNHQHRRDPHERTRAVYTRPEFVASLTVPVIGTLQLFEWWRDSDRDAIRSAVLGKGQTANASDAQAPEEHAPRGLRDRLRPGGRGR
jgi:hypothetical protein